MKKIIELDQYETFQPYVAEVKPLTPEQLQIEYMFIRAELFTRSLLICGMISCGEFRLIMAENRLSFPTYLSPLF
jgi:hypothetical protein